MSFSCLTLGNYYQGSDTSKESSLDDLLDALQNFSEGSNPESMASDAPDQVENCLSLNSKLSISKFIRSVIAKLKNLNIFQI